MAISVTGTTGPGPGTKLTPADAAFLDAATPRLHFIDGDQRHVALRMVSDGPGNVFPGQPKTPMVCFSAGGQQGEILLRLTQANVNDIVTSLVNFANNGVLS